MVVDDDPTHRGLISDLLTPLGFHVVEAHSGSDCLVLLPQCSCDAFLLDVSMPGMNGWQLAAALRANAVIEPIIMVSADAREGQHQPHNTREQPRWHDDYLAKPVRQTLLLEKLGNLLQLQWLHDPAVESAGASATAAEPFTAFASFTSQQLPTATELQELRALAEIGYVNGLKKKINQLSQEGKAAPEFIQHLQQLVSQFRFDRIVELTQR